jgi:RNA polymerase sigma-70 factor (sigma-E family)
VSVPAESNDGYTAFVAQRHRGLLKFAMVLCGDARLAEDLVADVLGRAYELWPRIGSLEHTHGYVRKMIVNDYLSWRRRLRRTFPVAELAELSDPVAAEPDPAEAHSDRQELAARLAALPVRQRACLVLRYYDGLADEQIAELLGCAVGTVRSNVSRALAALRIDAAEPLATTTKES